MLIYRKYVTVAVKSVKSDVKIRSVKNAKNEKEKSTMKKILAILLAAMMVFTLGLTAFAEGEDEGADTGILLPEFPAQTENEIYFVSENTYVDAGGTYEIPVYIVSNYTPSVEGYALIGMNLALEGDAAKFMSITGIKASAEAEALAGYNLVAADLAVGEDPNTNMFGFKTDDMSVFQQEAMPLAYVTVQVSEEYTGYGEDGEELDCQLTITPPQWFHYWENEYAMYAMGAPVEIMNPETFEQEVLWQDDGVVYVVSGHLIVTPPVPTWEERLKAWAIEQAIKIITFFQGLNEVLLGLLPTL